MDGFPQTRCVVADQNWAMGTTGNLLVAVWRGQPSLEHICSCGTECEKLAHQFLKNWGVVCVLECASPSPDAELHRVSFNKIRHSMRALATVIEGDAFRSPFVRLVNAGFASFSSAQQTRCHNDVSEASGWMRECLRETVPALDKEIESIRSAITSKSTKVPQ